MQNWSSGARYSLDRNLRVTEAKKEVETMEMDVLL